MWRTPICAFAGKLLNKWALSGALRAALELDDVDVLYIQEYWTGRFDLLAMLLPERV